MRHRIAVERAAGRSLRAIANALNTEPTEETRNRASRVVLEHLGWMTMAAGAGATGGVGLVPVIAQSVSPRWGAVLGAIGGILTYLFKVTVEDR